MNAKQCSAITKAGTRCRGRALPESDWCMAHDPKLAEIRIEARVRGGYGSRSENRAYKRLPAGIRDTLDALYRALSGLERGDVEPARASAMAAVARATVVTYEAGQVESRLEALEAKIEAKVA